MGMKARTLLAPLLAAASIALASNAQAAPILGYADVVLDYFNSGAGPIDSGPYGGTNPGSFPVSVSLDVVLGDDGPVVDFLSLPTGSYVTVGFLDETAVDGPGNDIFIQETGVAGERAQVYVSTDLVNFVLLGIASDDSVTAFDLNPLNLSTGVSAVRIVGLDNFGGSPGFDVVNVQVLRDSIGPPPPTSVPEPATLALLGLGLAGMGLARRRQRVPKH